MSSQCFQGIPGVPEGWELVRIDFVTEGEWYLFNGKPLQWGSTKNASDCDFPIIRKIEGFKTYRPFANGLEYIKKRGNSIAVDWKHIDTTSGFFAIVSANDSFVWVAFGAVITQFQWDAAFERLVFRHIDGSTSPFGVEVTE